MNKPIGSVTNGVGTSTQGASRPCGCDAWTGADYCDRFVPDSMHVDEVTSASGAGVARTSSGLYVDEVTDEVLCPEHAGPLAWSARKVNLYSLALRLAGEVDRPIPVPSERAA